MYSSGFARRFIHATRPSVNNKADVSANKEAENWKHYVFVGGSRVDPEVGTTVRSYMMEQVKPQHSFSRVRPVLVRGEAVGWALHRGRLAATPENPKTCLHVHLKQTVLFL